MKYLNLTNPVKKALLEDKVCLGITCSSGSSLAAETLGVAGCDWVMIDVEHFPIDVGPATEIIRACERVGVVPIIRLAANDPVWIKRFLDAGAMGIVLPLIQGAKDALCAVQWTRFPPEGHRPYGGGRVGLLYGNSYRRTANKYILLMVQIETTGAVNELDEILSIQEIDGCLVGPTDLSLAYGLPIPGEGQCEQREQLIQELARRIRAKGKIAGIVAASIEEGIKRIGQGYRLVSILSDLSLIRIGAENICKCVRQNQLVH